MKKAIFLFLAVFLLFGCGVHELTELEITSILAARFPLWTSHKGTEPRWYNITKPDGTEMRWVKIKANVNDGNFSYEAIKTSEYILNEQTEGLMCAHAVASDIIDKMGCIDGVFSR